jgi:hypothetical protein
MHDRALLLPSKDVLQHHVLCHGAVRIRAADRLFGKAPDVIHQEPRQGGIRRFNRGDASRISLTKRSCSVPNERSTRPLAGALLAYSPSMLSSCMARPNWVMSSPPSATVLLTRKMACLSE